jgi:outer membrane protein TolC
LAVFSAGAYGYTMSSNYNARPMCAEVLVDGNEFQRPGEWRAGGSLQWKLFEWGKTYHTYKQAEHKIFKLEAEHRNLRNKISFEVKAAYSTFGVAKSTFSSMLDKGLDTSKLVFGLCINWFGWIMLLYLSNLFQLHIDNLDV